MSVMKYANAVVVEPELDRQHWNEIHGRRRGAGLPKLAAGSPDLKQHLLSHTTIMSSVMCEDGHDDWLIKPECSHLVNNNQDAWENKVLELSYPTFRGAFNFLEHYQNTKASKGYILDAILRTIHLGDTGVWVYYCDILVATDLKHTALIQDIKSGRMRYLSMGCVTDLITCSFCGARSDGAFPACSHLANSKGRFLTDRDGVPRRVAELCFTPGARVVLGDGSRRAISDIQVGDTVLSHTGTRRMVSRTFMREYAGQMVSLGIAGLPQKLTSTPNHPYWVLSPRTHCTCGCNSPLAPTRGQGERRDYTRAYLPGHNPSASGDATLSAPAFTFKEAEELRVGDLVALPVPTEVVSPSDVDRVRAELLGWFLAEGSYYSHGGKRSGVAFTLNGADEVHIAERIASLLEQAFAPEPRRGSTNPSTRKAPKIYHYARTEGGTKLVVHYNNDAALGWFLHHAGEYAETKKLSADAVLWPLDIQRAVLQTYVAGDGTVDGVARFSVVSISETLISQMQIIAARLGLWTRRQVIFGGKATALDAVPALQRDRNNFRPLHTLHFQPSEETTQFFGSPAGLTHVRQIAPGWRQHNGYMLYRVTEVATEDYTGPVHNIEVEGDHSYLVEGIAVHNCGHKSLPGGGVKFVEASWVGTPAFPGAANRSEVMGTWDVEANPKVAALHVPQGGLTKVASEKKTELPSSSNGQAHVAAAEMRRLR